MQINFRKREIVPLPDDRAERRIFEIIVPPADVHTGMSKFASDLFRENPEWFAVKPGCVRMSKIFKCYTEANGDTILEIILVDSVVYEVLSESDCDNPLIVG